MTCVGVGSDMTNASPTGVLVANATQHGTVTWVANGSPTIVGPGQSVMVSVPPGADSASFSVSFSPPSPPPASGEKITFDVIGVGEGTPAPVTLTRQVLDVGGQAYGHPSILHYLMVPSGLGPPPVNMGPVCGRPSYEPILDLNNLDGKFVVGLRPSSARQVPILPSWGLGALCMALVGAGGTMLARRRSAVS